MRAPEPGFVMNPTTCKNGPGVPREASDSFVCSEGGWGWGIIHSYIYPFFLLWEHFTTWEMWAEWLKGGEMPVCGNSFR